MKFDSLLWDSLHRRDALKVISGLNNFNLDSVLTLTEAANIGGATYIDMCADSKIISAVKRNTALPVCVSLTSYHSVEEALSAGADFIEIGNFDTLYHRGIQFSDNDIFEMAFQIKTNYPKVILCVTLPYILTISQQIDLVKRLESINVDLVQTEGAQANIHKTNGISSNLFKAASTLYTTHCISEATKIPVITASKLSEYTITNAVSCGASGVGVGNAIMSLKDIPAMSKKIQDLKLVIHKNSSVKLDSFNIIDKKLKCSCSESYV
uniref:hypothetical protein n=1 Tax=Erythrolobus coxiae TaxID=362235 RepID=UPI001FCDC13A|nr:hypothetical protein MW556_pgp132 [Erythrolobus coxiae]UNJ17675.1 hypothetical protein [Erythrolobus coxiae]